MKSPRNKFLNVLFALLSLLQSTYSILKHISTIHERKKEESSFSRFIENGCGTKQFSVKSNSNFDSTDLQKHISTVHDGEKKNQLLESNYFILSNHVEYIKLLKVKSKNKLNLVNLRINSNLVKNSNSLCFYLIFNYLISEQPRLLIFAPLLAFFI